MQNAPTLVASPFAIVADLRPASPVIVLMTPVYTSTLVAGEEFPAHDHRAAVLFDEDEDERVIDVLTAILYRAPNVYRKIVAIAEHRGFMTVWLQMVSHADRVVLFKAADPVATRGDRWPVEVREMFLDTESGAWMVKRYTDDGGAIPSVGMADNRDLLVQTLFEVVPLGGDWTHWSVPLYSDPGASCVVGAAGLRRRSTLTQPQQFTSELQKARTALEQKSSHESDPQLTREINEVLAQTPQPDNSRKPTLTLKRGRGSRE
jgi:hypothetical protein